MSITTVPVTIRVNKEVVTLAKTEAAKRNVYYQTVLNERMAKSFGVNLPANLPNKKLGAAKKKVAKVLKRPKTKFKLKPSSKSKKAKQ